MTKRSKTTIERFVDALPVDMLDEVLEVVDARIRKEIRRLPILTDVEIRNLQLGSRVVAETYLVRVRAKGHLVSMADAVRLVEWYRRHRR